MNKNRNKVAAMMMAAAITVSSVAMPVEAAVSSVESVGIERENNASKNEDIYLNDIPDEKFRRVIINEARDKNITIGNDGKIKKEDIEKFESFRYYWEEAKEPINLEGIQKFTGLKYLEIDYLDNKDLVLSGNKNLQIIDLQSANKLESINLSEIETLKSLTIDITNMKSLDLSTNTGLEKLVLLGDTKYSKKGLGYLKLNENIQLNSSNLSKNIQHTSVVVDKESGIKGINLEEEFPGINPDNIILNKDQGVTIEGNMLKWKDFPTKAISYQYKTQGKDNKALLNVRLYIEDSYGITEGVEINKTNFPDERFRKYICSSKFTENDNNIAGGWHFNEGETISAEMLRKITKIDVGNDKDYDGKKIENLKGIEYFKNLRNLYCQNNEISQLDLSQNTKLENLNCEGNNIGKNGLSDLNLLKNANLEVLNCNNNVITNINLSNNTKLESLNCQNNKIEDIDLSNNKELLELDIRENLLSGINIESNDKLKDLRISDNIGISEIDISDKASLDTLYCGNNNITNLNIKNNSELKTLEISYSYHTGKYIQNLDVSSNTNLESLTCNGNKMLEDINLSNNIKLKYIFLSNNSLKNIDLTNNADLLYLKISENKLRNLDLSKNLGLKELYISKNEIGKLIVNENANQYIIKEGNAQSIKLKADGNKIDLNKEFGITESEMKNVTELSEGISKNGTNLTWTGKKPEKIKYTYLCGGKNNPVKLFVTLDLSGNGVITPDPDKPNPNPNPDQGGSGGGSGTTTPDQKPDQKPDEKPSKPSNPANITSKVVGRNRYETAAKIADELVKNNVSYNSVILVNSDKSMADGLSAASLSGKKNAPILLVKKDSIPAEAMEKIERAKNVYIIGGEGAISKKVENQLKGKNITRISGKDRYETSAKIANMLGGYKMAFIVNGAKGEADAMSVSAVAAKYGAPILLTNGKTSTHPVRKGVSYFVIGGRSVVSNQLADKYNADRIAGVDRYSTNRKVMDEFYYDSKKVYFAKGDTLVDALTASLLAKNNGMVLVSKNANHKKLEGKEAVQIGGMDFEINLK